MGGHVRQLHVDLARLRLAVRERAVVERRQTELHPVVARKLGKREALAPVGLALDRHHADVGRLDGREVRRQRRLRRRVREVSWAMSARGGESGAGQSRGDTHRRRR